MARKVTKKKQEKIKELLEEGLSYREIGKKVGVSRQTVSNIKNEDDEQHISDEAVKDEGLILDDKNLSETVNRIIAEQQEYLAKRKLVEAKRDYYKELEDEEYWEGCENIKPLVIALKEKYGFSTKKAVEYLCYFGSVCPDYMVKYAILYGLVFGALNADPRNRTLRLIADANNKALKAIQE